MFKAQGEHIAKPPTLLDVAHSLYPLPKQLSDRFDVPADLLETGMRAR
jgi:hypothetical protein